MYSLTRLTMLAVQKPYSTLIAIKVHMYSLTVLEDTSDRASVCWDICIYCGWSFHFVLFCHFVSWL